MKKYVSRGFTLVELMIVIAIIGILAAVLYPAMTGYFERSRDMNRVGAMNQISLALGTYYTDKENYPDAEASKCLEGTVKTKLEAGYIKSLPREPKKIAVTGLTNACQSGDYGYIKL